MRFRSGLFLALALGTLAAAPAPGRTTKKSVLPFIADDYAKALHEARARKVPIFIEAWAPW